MTSKTRYIKYGKISERKLSLIVRCFASDATASLCAQVTKINRNTANLYYHHFRRLVLRNQEQERMKFFAEEKTEVDEAY